MVVTISRATAINANLLTDFLKDSALNCLLNKNASKTLHPSPAGAHCPTRSVALKFLRSHAALTLLGMSAFNAPLDATSKATCLSRGMRRVFQRWTPCRVKLSASAALREEPKYLSRSLYVMRLL